MPAETFETHKSFAEIVDQYDGFILDQFGVMHNGQHGLQGASECVEELVQSGKKLIILSNTSSSAEAAEAKLPKLGFDASQFVKAPVTSGEEASHYIAQTFVGKKALFLTWKTPMVPSPCQFLELCGNIDVTDQVEEADFCILHGSHVLRGPGVDGEATETSLGSFAEDGLDFSILDPILKKCHAKHLPMVCANPDYTTIRPDGTTGHMPGKISDRYQDMGGPVVAFGKPHVPHFEACLRELGLPKDRVCHVGDSLHHDIKGANDTGIDSVFVAGGIHRQELGSKELGELPAQNDLEELFEKHSQTPTHVVPLLSM
jgi:HAD superfamily hydrolase (TIGR01450 family)